MTTGQRPSGGRKGAVEAGSGASPSAPPPCDGRGESTAAGRGRKPGAYGLIGLVSSAVLLWWVFHDEDLGAIAGEIAAADPVWLAASVFVATAGFLVRALRWNVLLAPLGARIGLRSRFAATTIGFMANNLLPMRAGEFARAWSLARMEKLSLSGCLASLVAERLFDGLTISVLLVTALLLPGFRTGADGAGELVRTALTGFAVVLALAIVAVVLLLAFPERAQALLRPLASWFPPGARARVESVVEGVVQGLGALRSPRLLLLAAAWSLFFWLWHTVSFWLGFRAFDIAVGYPGALFLNGVTALAVAVPSAPGFFGPFEAAVEVALVNVLGVGESRALAFAAGYHISTFIPVTVIGLCYLPGLGFFGRGRFRLAFRRHAAHGTESCTQMRKAKTRRGAAGSGRLSEGVGGRRCDGAGDP